MTDEVNGDLKNSIKFGKYIIINRKKYSKLHLLTDNSSVYLGKDKVFLNNVIGQPFWSTFKMVPKNSKREFTLTVCKPEDIVENDDFFKSKIKSGTDNRNIQNDGSSQLLSTEEINEMRDSGLSSQTIVGCLIKNSKTFLSKTEYSKEKYLKKKGTKYFEYLTIKKPTIRLLSELFYFKDQTKILGLRPDSLSQIITSVNLQPDGTYVLYENGSQGLVAATILNYLSDCGKLVYVTPGKHPQQHAILSMNFNTKLNCLKCVSLTKLCEEFGGLVTCDKDAIEIDKNVKGLIDAETGKLISVRTSENMKLNEEVSMINMKRKLEESDDENLNSAKKSRWELEAEEGLNLLKSKKSDGLIIVCKEYPLHLFTKLLNFIEYSRPFVLFNLSREPLSQLYIELKSRRNIINLRLTETWLRSYQVLPDRTHPDVLMSGNSGHLLTGTIVNNL